MFWSDFRKEDAIDIDGMQQLWINSPAKKANLNKSSKSGANFKQPHVITDVTPVPKATPGRAPLA
jgi:hypothetical protein